MKITIVQGAFLPVPPMLGGAMEKVWFALGQEFARRGHEVKHISRAYPGLSARETRGGVKHRRLSGFAQPRSLAVLKLLDLWYSLRVRAILPEGDILVTNTFWLPMLVRSPRLGKLCVHVARYPKGQLRFYRHAAQLLTLSSPIARAMAEQEPSIQKKIAMLPLPLPASDQPNTESKRELSMLYVGRIHPEKGIGLLVDAFGRFLKQSGTTADGWKLTVVGPWKESQGGGGEDYHRDLLAQAAPLGNRIEWVGPVFGAGKLEAYYRRASLFIYPSLAELGETFGLAPLEAMAQGCPPLVSSLECFQDFIADGDTGFIFDHRAPDPAAALAGKLATLAGNPVLLRETARRAQQASLAYRPEVLAERYLANFSSLLISS
jgi:glycosyltransferase involved in cell wall biosynthesis